MDVWDRISQWQRVLFQNRRRQSQIHIAVVIMKDSMYNHNAKLCCPVPFNLDTFVPTNPMFKWLVANVGERFGPWNWTWAGEGIIVYFNNEEDKVKFILKWL